MKITHVLILALAILPASCASLSPDEDRAEVHAAVSTRSGAQVPLPPPDNESGLADELRALLAVPLDEESAVHIALLNNRRVRAVYEQLGVGRADLVQAGLLRNPTFDLDVRFVEGGGTDMEFGISQPILELFFRPLRQKLAEHEFAAAKLRVTEELVALVFTVRRAVVRARAAEELVSVRRQAVQVAASSHELMRLLHAAGNASDQSLAIERAGESRARIDLAAAEQTQFESREPLHSLLGLWGLDTTWALVEGVPTAPFLDLDVSGVESRAIEASLELLAHREGLNAIAQQAGLDSWRGWFPELALGASGIRIPGGTWGFGPRLEGELPLFDQGAPRRAKSAARLRAGMHEYAQIAVEVRAAARLSMQRRDHLVERSRFMREVHLPQRAKVVRTTLQNYNAMQIGVFDVFTERQIELADLSEHVRTLRDAHLAELDLRQVLAGGMPESTRSALHRDTDENLEN